MGKRWTKDDFIKRAREVHGDRYDYSLVNYINSRTKVKVICKEHGEFLQVPYHHLKGGGCPRCNGGALKSQEIWLEDARKTHGVRYDYSKVEYKNDHNKVTIICKEHGEWKQHAGSHVRGCGCPRCNGGALKSSGEFIEDARKTHGVRYDYSKVEYEKDNIKVRIVCKEHGEFLQVPSSHLQGNGCPRCVGRNKTNEEYIELAKRVHGEKYDYSLLDYNRKANKMVTVICPDHGIFKQNLFSHIGGGCGCPRCHGRNRPNEEYIELAKRVHGEKYDYSLLDYSGHREKVNIRCKEHGIFKQNLFSHISGSGCPRCTVGKIGINESKYFQPWVEKMWSNQYKFQYMFADLPYYVDVYFPEHKLVIEYDEDHHEKQKDNDLERQLLIEDYCGVRFYRIPDKDFLDKMDYHRDKILRLIGLGR
jgi:very-short-patch-repair endonuclease/Zn finger protein HypA/HybF involved in hydrogenase expression